MQGFANAGDCAMTMSLVLPANAFESIEKTRIPANPTLDIWAGWVL
jgi:hypothetical protein